MINPAALAFSLTNEFRSSITRKHSVITPEVGPIWTHSHRRHSRLPCFFQVSLNRFQVSLNLFKGIKTNSYRDQRRLRSMSGRVIKVSVSLAAVAMSAASLFTISWIGLALLGF
jgi:hypothetical protein